MQKKKKNILTVTTSVEIGDCESVDDEVRWSQSHIDPPRIH